MRNFWLVAKYEYGRVVGRRAFLILTLAIPLGYVALIALAILIEGLGDSDLPMGYVDEAGLLVADRQADLPDAEDRIQVIAYADLETAVAALEAEEIQAFFLFPKEYSTTRHTELYYLQEPPGEEAMRDFVAFMRINMLSSLPPIVQQRMLAGANITVHDTANGRTFGKNDINIAIPFIAALLFVVATMVSAGNLIQVVADEKENRTVEILLTTVTPGQLIGGKTFGLVAVALTQLGIYLGTALVGLRLATPYVSALQDVTISWTFLGIMFLFFLPSFALIAATMVAIGSAVATTQQAEQVSGILTLLFLSPVYLLVLIFENPGAPFVVFMSLFPPTAFLTISLRWGLGSVLLWQLGTSLVLLVATALFMAWAASRIFRLGMLRYGQPLNVRTIVKVLRGIARA